MIGDRLKGFASPQLGDQQDSVMPMVDSSAVSFCRPMKSFSSGGMTRRTACGTRTVRRVWV